MQQHMKNCARKMFSATRHLVKKAASVLKVNVPARTTTISEVAFAGRREVSVHISTRVYLKVSGLRR